AILLSIMRRPLGLDDLDRGGDRVGLVAAVLGLILAGIAELVVAVVGGVLDALVGLVLRTRRAGLAGPLGGEDPGVLGTAPARGVHDHLPAWEGDAGEPAWQHPDVVAAVQREGAQVHVA